MMEFSVLMSVYDAEAPEYLILALDSVLHQTCPPAEIVLVEDGPLTEALNAVVSRYTAEHPKLFKIIQIQENVGLGPALNLGLQACSNEVVFRMDTDDVCYPERFEKQIGFLEAHPEISVLGTSIQEFDQTPGDMGRYRNLPTSDKALLDFAKYRNPLNHPTVAFRKAHILEVGCYQDVPLFEDYFLWARVIMAGHTIHNMGEALLHFRVGNDMVGRRHGLSYGRKEYAFLQQLKRIGFLSSREFLTSVLVKTPLRLLPKSMLLLLYKKFLR